MLKYIRKFYGVPAYRGGRIIFEGKYGTIIGGDMAARLRVRFDGEKHASFLHPSWKIEYLNKEGR